MSTFVKRWFARSVCRVERGDTALVTAEEGGNMSGSVRDGVAVIKPDQTYVGKQGFTYRAGAFAETVGAQNVPVNDGKQTMKGVTPPIYQWTPVIAPSGMIFYSDDAFPDWKNNLFVGGLAAASLVRLELEGDRAMHEERLLTRLGHRIRDIAQAPDGTIYVITDEDDGRLLRLAPE
jgi:hypothetical protein